LSPEDLRIWRALAQTVRPLSGKDLPTDPQDCPAEDTSPARQEPPAAALPIPSLKTPRPKKLTELAVGKPIDVDKNTGKRLAKGDLAIDGRLDLHGLAQAEAQARVTGFIQQAYGRDWRCVLIITGKGNGGHGVLKTEVPRWLNLPSLRPLIVAVTPAIPKDGGDGALYVLIRRRRT
jgi:DNA-nicking Smr family endonuclease